MLTINVSNKQLHEHSAQGYVVLCQSGDVTNDPVVSSLECFYKPLKRLINERKFKGGPHAQLVVAGDNDGKPGYIMLFGLGKLEELSFEDKIERYRRAIGSMMRTIESLKITNVVIAYSDPEKFDVDAFKLGLETASTADMATFHFDLYITDENRRHEKNITLTLCVPDDVADQFKTGIHQGTHIGYAVNQARHWCDLPGNIITPTTFAERTKKIAQTHNLKITVFGKEDILDMNMGGIYAVSKGSAEEPRLVIMEYRTEKPNAPTIALVGKGITFDTGGLSIKPAVPMETMKDDMAGAAVAISTVEALAHLKPHVNIIGIAPLAENMPSGTATRPGDIIRFYNGKTAEVKNTDAEGRLILADALSYAVKNYKLDAIINVATLTGSCAAALGPFYCGLMSKHDKLSDMILEAAKRSGDRVWRLPFHDDYKPAIRSDVADLSNIGSDRYRAGAITAGFFLHNFVDDVPWAHLDIAGTAFNVPDISYYRPGATGFGVRLFVDLFMNWPVKSK